MMDHGVGRDRDDRRPNPPAQRLFGPDHVRGGQAVHDRHLHVHQDEIPCGDPPGVEGLGPVLHHHRAEPDLLEQGLQHQTVDAVILGGEHAQGGDRAEGRTWGRRFAGHGRGFPQIGEGRAQGEGRPAVRRAEHLDPASHHPGEVLRNAEPKARAAEAAGRAGIGLRKRLEQRSELLRRQADAGVLHLQHEVRALPRHV